MRRLAEVVTDGESQYYSAGFSDLPSRNAPRPGRVIGPRHALTQESP